MNTKTIAESFSSHAFAQTYPHLADEVRWVVPGRDPIEGRDAVVAACERTLAEVATTATLDRFVSVADATTAAVDAVGRYVGADGTPSLASSADIYEFDADDRVVRITSYAVEL